MRWRIAVDRGGTFTDIVATAPDGRHLVRKVPSADAESPLAAIRDVLGQAPGARIPASLVESVRCGTTVATNALLERRGERCVLFVTEGFGDLLRIGTQARPDLFALRIVLPEPIPERIVEVPERRLADGTVRNPLDEAALRAAADAARRDGFDSAVVLFLHSYRYPEHELAAGDVVRAAGFAHVALSHEAAREIKALPRGETACADAYLTPLLRRSLGRFAEGFEPGVDLRFMQSDGGLAAIAHVSGPRAVLSGPAGGVVATGAVARLAGEPRAIGFDMGGTSTDVCRWADGAERVYETRVAGVRLRVPSLRIVTVASGGGSRLDCDGRRLLAGPRSVGAVPGPAGYGLGDAAALTDANAVLGRLVPARFPRCFGPTGDRPFDVAASRRAVGVVAARAGLGGEEAAAGFVRVAVERMAQAIREVSTARGHDVRDHALVCFGGAGAQHACALARALGMRRVLLHPLGSLLSAWGIGLARAAHEQGAAVLAPWDDDGLRAATSACDALEHAGRERLAEEGVERVDTSRLVELRYVGVDATTVVPLGTLATTHAAFEEAHQRLYGFVRRGHAVEVVNARVRVEESGDDQRETFVPASAPATPAGRQPVWFQCDDGLLALDTPVIDLGSLCAGDEHAGPALLVDDVTTVVVEPGWRARLDDTGVLVLEAQNPAPRPRAGTQRDPVFLALFANAFMSVAERMGAVLERVSLSTNIKERLDFSCAVFDGDGRLVANAPHIPVHLGAMGESVRAVAAARGTDLREGDAIVTNDPFRGGSHLPDVTVVTPVLVRGGRARFYVANRAHHADVGGITPGSMPPLSRSIAEEGVCVHDLLLVRDGVLREDAVRAAFGGGPHPARALDERLADLRAQVAANMEGARLLRAMADESGAEVVAAYMGHVQDDGEAAMTEMLRRLPDGEHAFEDALDDGTPLCVTVTIDGGRAVVDFAGTGPRSDGNLNAPRAVTRAAVLFALRTLIGREVPLNEGCLRPVEIRIPEGSLLDPHSPCAVVGGNVETSMRLVDVVLAALGAVAGSQGTMNNVTFGRPRTGPDAESSAYYETIGGGSGAGRDFDGASAVQIHMTNTRITDPEIVELRWPVVVRRFAIRRGSGGPGAQRGGDGTIREIEFLEAMEGGILSQRRTSGAFGLAGGSPGAPGRNVHIQGGEERDLPGRAALDLRPGDVLRIETPGGGGYGPVSP